MPENPFAYNPSNLTLEAFGLGLWAGEGTKYRKKVEVTNCNPTIIKSWVQFLTEICGVDVDRLKLRIQLHNPNNIEDAIRYWHDVIGAKPIARVRLKALKSTVEKRPFGTVTVGYYSVKLYEQIQERLGEMVGVQA